MSNKIIYNKNKNNYINLLTNYPCSTTAVLGSGATGHFLQDNSPQDKRELMQDIFTIKQPNGEGLHSKYKSQIKIFPELPNQAQEAHSFPKIKIPSVSVGKLCGSGCVVIFVKNKGFITYKGKVIGEAPRDEITRLWTLPLNKTNNTRPAKKQKGFSHVANNLTFPREAQDNIEQLILFLHEALGDPTRSTFIRAVKKGHLVTWPGHTVNRIKKYIKQDIITDKGQMYLTRQVKHKE